MFELIRADISLRTVICLDYERILLVSQRCPGTAEGNVHTLRHFRRAVLFPYLLHGQRNGSAIPRGTKSTCITLCIRHLDGDELAGQGHREAFFAFKRRKARERPVAIILRPRNCQEVRVAKGHGGHVGHLVLDAKRGKQRTELHARTAGQAVRIVLICKVDGVQNTVDREAFRFKGGCTLDDR